MDDLYGNGIGKDAVSTIASLLQDPDPMDELRLTTEPNNSYYASGAGLCFRKTAAEKVLGRMGQVTVRDTAQELYFRLGNAYEDVVAGRFKDKGVLLDRELRVEEPLLNLSGRIDFVVDWAGEITLIELKTCGKLPTSPRKGHAAQLLLYMALTGINRGYVWYMSRSVADWHNGLLHAPLPVTPTDDALRATLMNVALGKLWAEQGAVPDKPPWMRKTHCGFCELQDVCWNGGDVTFPTSIDDPEATLLEAKAIVELVMEKRPERAKEMERYFLGR